jgi:hypothetical protein
MRTFTLQQSRTEVYTPHGGLALVGHCLNRHTSLTKTARTVVKRHGIPNIELIRTYLGLITVGKSDFEAAEPVRTDPFFKSALGIKQSPSSARLRQRFDEDAKALVPLLDDASVEFLQSVEVPVSPLEMGHVALDMDVFPMDNSQTHKEGVSYTYKGYDGYAPMAAYQAQKAWTLERDGKMEAVLSEDLPDEPGLRRIAKVTVRTSDASGQLYLEPDVSLEGWITSLPAEAVSDQQLMALYSGRQWILRFGRHCPGFAVYRDLYRGLASSG